MKTCIWLMGLLLATSTLLVSCMEADLRIPEIPGTETPGPEEPGPDEPDTDAAVQIRPNLSEHTLPALLYHFYNTDGVTPCLTAPCDGNGNYEGRLPLGTYHIIATNTDAENVLFNGMQNHESATVEVQPLAAPTRNPLLRADYRTQPGAVYSVVFADLTVAAAPSGEPIVKQPDPTLLTKELILSFIIEGELAHEVTALSGGFTGAYPAVNLYSGLPVNAGTAPEHITPYQGTATTDGNWTTAISHFGIYTPPAGSNYRNLITVSIDLADGATLSTEVDLTQDIAKAIEQNGGTIPIQLPLQIKLARVNAQLTAETIPWQPSGGGEGEMN